MFEIVLKPVDIYDIMLFIPFKKQLHKFDEYEGESSILEFVPIDVPIDVPTEKKNNTDLIITVCGEEDCAPGHFFGPAIRDYYLMHFILDGKGFFEAGGKKYHLVKGQGFLICPYDVTYYEACQENPWHYSWVGFYGLKAKSYLKKAGLTRENPIFNCQDVDSIKDCFKRMLDTRALSKSREITILGLLHLFLAYLIESNDSRSPVEKSSKDSYVKEAVNYIAMNYSRNIDIQEIADHIKLNRSYLYSLFMDVLNTSPRNFLINFRINKACELMKEGSPAIGDISRSVGYEDPLQFSKIFRKIMGISPREHRNRL